DIAGLKTLHSRSLHNKENHEGTMRMSLKSAELNHFPRLPLQAAEFNKSIDAENKAGSRVLLTQHPRPSLISGHDWRSDQENKN
ncbi:MAG: hypothetical protein KKB51_09315, partial [Candidatus Riflebacteria bacterium]|nr:hypothetical protein [Candidatus Riflebacteria bacterium]